MPMSELVGYCGGSQTDIRQSINAYRDLEHHYRAVIEDRDDEFDTTRFSAFAELQKPGIKEALFEAGFNEREFSEWVAKKMLSPLSHVRKLPQILKDQEIRDIFLNRGSREAINTLNAPDSNSTLKESSILQLAQALQEKIDHLPYDDAETLIGDPDSNEYLELKDLMTSLAELLNIETAQ